MITHLYVTPAVSALQFDLETAGDVTLAPAAASKTASTNRVGGALRVVVFGLNADLIEGHIATVNAAVGVIAGVVGADGNAVDVGARMTKLSQIQGMEFTLLNPTERR